MEINLGKVNAELHSENDKNNTKHDSNNQLEHKKSRIWIF